MKSILVSICLLFTTLGFPQGYEYFIMESEVDEFDVFGDDSYESNLTIDGNLNQKLEISVGSEVSAPDADGSTFVAKNTIDANMKTVWLTPDNGKNALIEYVIDIEDSQFSSATIYQIAFFNGWRKDYQTWKDYSRIKKVSLTINDRPYAEITLDDTYKYQKIDLDKMKIDKTRRYRFRFRVMEMYPGKKHEQVAISDVQFVGKAK